MTPDFKLFIEISAYFISHLGTQLLYSTLIFIPVFLIIIIFRKRLSIYIKMGLWLLFWMRLVLPPDFALPFSASQIIAGIFHHHNSGEVINQRSHESATEDTASNSIHSILTVKHPYRMIVLSGLFLCWICGAIIFTIRYIRHLIYYRHIVKKSRHADDRRLDKLLDQWKNRLNIRQNIQVVVTRQPISPFITGVLIPIIVIPESLLKTKDIRLLESVLAHELAHIQSLDTLWSHVQGVLQIFYFFHPAVWIASYHWNYLRESFADSRVIQKHWFSRDHYCSSLIALIKLKSKPMEVPMKPAFGSQKKYLIIRLLNLQTSKELNPRRIIGVCWMMIAAFFFILPMHVITSEHDNHADADLQSKKPIQTSAELQVPLKGHIRSGFGKTMHPVYKKEYMHKGVDIPAKKGTSIQSVADGLVTVSNDPAIIKKGYGKHVIIKHNKGFETLYAHMDTIFVECGQTVKQGDTIGTVGNTGVSTGPHLHFELHLNGEPVNPEDYIEF